MAARKPRKTLPKNPRSADGKQRLTGTLRIGAIAFSFLILGYQIALFIHSTAAERLLSITAHPDTVYVYRHAEIAPAPKAQCGKSGTSGRVKPVSNKDKRIEEIVGKAKAVQEPETFIFNPNNASIEELMRLGFTEKQAQSIENYRAKGGKFRRPEDFDKSYAVNEKMFERLKSFIDIPLLDINEADSAAFDALPGIGPYFAAKMVSFRKELGGYSCKEQLMDIWNFDEEKYKALEDLIRVGNPHYFDLWGSDIEELKKHPYIRNYSKARSIVFYIKNNPEENWSVEGLQKAGIIDENTAKKLLKCIK